ncbi:energy-converting hydrogenase A, subunit R [Methanothermobacter tenebrarum]|uniref:phosphoserine phosphatase n=1 Tax=Methanothermobacter tenebrarum TaxID=680118 RepID=A0A328PH98_9EURY|nr:energy-converting hydrogenase A, subunit R [Methanothermobacter tenebrarum]MBC7100996.1 energy-converting hydrogenase A, subunit R [Methanobacteriales archaeon]MBC7117430.1 energy-converting hydrogenase A, subunit R [Methanobacteriaceae archaeon]NPV64692.1 energy-converting hydrogenase A, subunit R [Methanobacteriaceae archaeon]RAO79026.1 energy-converting hydrogenase A, subunit R [Methanothermobacter tenebrarum]
MKKLFVTDCEGPISLNDNAFELASHFIPDGDKFFAAVSKYDDILAYEIKRPGYNAGDTLKLITPFLKAYNVTNDKIVEFSKENISLVPWARELLQRVQGLMPSYIISTSYKQYIEALCNLINFPLENTYYTSLDIDSHELPEDEREKLFQFKDMIVEGADFETMDKIFFEEIPQMRIGKLIEDVKTVGGEGKRLALKEILKKEKLPIKSTLYIGDSITDVEPLRYTRGRGLAVSFNGNHYAVREADIVIIAENALPLALIADLHSRFGRDYIIEFVKAYTMDPERALENFRISYNIFEKFMETSKKKFPRILIPDDNIEEIAEESLQMRKRVRGEAIGGLG